MIAFVNNKFQTLESACGTDEFFGNTGDAFLDDIAKNYNDASKYALTLTQRDRSIHIERAACQLHDVKIIPH